MLPCKRAALPKYRSCIWCLSLVPSKLPSMYPHLENTKRLSLHPMQGRSCRHRCKRCSYPRVEKIVIERSYHIRTPIPFVTTRALLWSTMPHLLSTGPHSTSSQIRLQANRQTPRTLTDMRFMSQKAASNERKRKTWNVEWCPSFVS